MLEQIRTKIRALIEDIAKSDFETFEYTVSKIFNLSESNIQSIVKVLKNGLELGSGEYSYDSTTNKIEILIDLSSGDIIEVDFIYNKYSDTELNGFITASLSWISIFGTCSQDFEIEDEDTIHPTPENKEIDLISIIASILIKPDYTEYRLPNLTVRYLRKMTKEEKIENLVNKFNSGIGVMDVLEWD